MARKTDGKAQSGGNHKPVLRFAPSPNGLLHLGHACSALLNWQLARRLGGRFLLRIEDIDRGRARERFEQAIYDDLAWLGIEWERPVRRQSEHMADYAAALKRLDEMGVLYPCFAIRREIVEEAQRRGLGKNPDGAPLYPGLYRDYPAARARARMEAGEPHALRIDMKKAMAMAKRKAPSISFRQWSPESRKVTSVEVDPSCWGDAVIARKDIGTSYNLAVVVDDAIQKVSHVVRGRDLLPATSLQRLLQILLDLPAPLYYHHELVRDEQGRKLSKSIGSLSLAQMRQNGLRPDRLATLCPKSNIASE